MLRDDVRVTARPGLLLAAVLVTGCSAGTSAFDACVEHSVEEGVDRAAAEAACERLEE